MLLLAIMIRDAYSSLSAAIEHGSAKSGWMCTPGR